MCNIPLNKRLVVNLRILLYSFVSCLQLALLPGTGLRPMTVIFTNHVTSGSSTHSSCCEERAKPQCTTVKNQIRTAVWKLLSFTRIHTKKRTTC